MSYEIFGTSRKSSPDFRDLMAPVLRALLVRGGEATTSDIDQLVVSDVGVRYGQGWTENLGSKLAWARSSLKEKGLVANPERGRWLLRRRGLAWARQALATCSQAGDPSGLSGKDFERFCQTYLKAAGFTSVRVIGRSGDGGIDGFALYEVSPRISFRLAFQCKSMIQPVSARLLREFRGAVTGRADKGLFITTSRFTRAASDEARRGRGVSIDLLDGQDIRAIGAQRL